jgi:hypothetical protein
MDPLNQEAIEETQESFDDELATVERQVAQKFGIRGRVRLEIARRVKDGTIPESGLVMRWLALYATLLARLREHSPPPDVSGHREQEAASGGLFFCPILC